MEVRPCSWLVQLVLVLMLHNPFFFFFLSFKFWFLCVCVFLVYLVWFFFFFCKKKIPLLCYGKKKKNYMFSPSLFFTNYMKKSDVKK